MENYAKRHAVPLITPPAGTRKEQFVARFYQRYRDQEGVVVILKSMEQSPTFISYEPRYRPASGDDDYRLIKRAAKRFLHYYFYVMDPVMRPMSLCVSSYLPFGVNCYINGHSYLAQQAELLDSTVDTGALARLARLITTDARRVPGIKLHDDRGIRLLETLLHSGGLVGDWTTRDLHEHVLRRHPLSEPDTLGQLRYDRTYPYCRSAASAAASHSARSRARRWAAYSRSARRLFRMSEYGTTATVARTAAPVARHRLSSLRPGHAR